MKMVNHDDDGGGIRGAGRVTETTTTKNSPFYIISDKSPS